MSQLLDSAIREFQELWKKNFQEEISWEQAVIRAQEVFTALRMQLEPIVETNETSQIQLSHSNEDRLKEMQTIISVENKNQTDRSNSDI